MTDSVHKHKKHFGQHFLSDDVLIDQLVEFVAPQANDAMIEIGPGIGAMTKPLLNTLKHLSVVEIDRDCIKCLKNTISDKKLTIYAQDVLTFHIKNHAEQGETYRIVGNLPYNISTPLLFHLYEQSDVIQDMHVMLQHEVAARICAPVDSSAYGRLSVMSQYYCAPTWLCDIGPECFDPPPKVNSAFIRLVPNNNRDEAIAPFLSNVVSTAFNQRRKTIGNSLKKLISVEQLDSLGINPKLRPQNISLAQYLTIARWLAEQPRMDL